ncbi:hypothetical protein DER46DRAFT_664846 [Fusarium sp. MPI-SDFR-AT-0072]|nr:hypothetical protein DER46DRAFT_664846 [Fusarium sp. MPI-SDFR-AT-0072]
MCTASAEKPDSGANVEILKIARKIQHLAHFLSQGPPFAGVVLSDDDLRIALELNPVTRITSHHRLSELEFPREWQEKQFALQQNLKLQLDVEALQRKAQSLYQALFDPDNRIHEAKMIAKVKLHGEICQLEKSLDAANSKNESLVKKNKDLESCNKCLVTENEVLVEENKDLDSDNGDLITTSQDLLAKIALARDAANSYKELLMAKNQALECSNEVLAMEITALNTSNELVVAESSKLKQRFEQSVIATKSCKDRLDRITAKIKELESSKNGLAAQHKDLMNNNAVLSDTGVSWFCDYWSMGFA